MSLNSCNFVASRIDQFGVSEFGFVQGWRWWSITSERWVTVLLVFSLLHPLGTVLFIISAICLLVPLSLYSCRFSVNDMLTICLTQNSYICICECPFLLKSFRNICACTLWAYVNASLVLLQSLELSDTEVGNNVLQHLSGLSWLLKKKN